MSATKELTYDKIVKLRQKIDEMISHGEDPSPVQEELSSLTEMLNKQVLVESSAQILKG